MQDILIQIHPARDTNSPFAAPPLAYPSYQQHILLMRPQTHVMESHPVIDSVADALL